MARRHLGKSRRAGRGPWVQQFQGDAVGIPGFTSSTDVDLFLTMSPGERSSRVSWVWGIVAGTAPMPVPDLYDPQMVDVVKRYQSRKGLADDGIIGVGTFARLARENA